MNAVILSKYVNFADEKLLCNMGVSGIQGSGFRGDILLGGTDQTQGADNNQGDTVPNATNGKDKDPGTGPDLTPPANGVTKEGIEKLAGLFTGTTCDTIMSIMAEIAKAMAEQKRENREMRDVNTKLAVAEKLNQAEELNKKADDIWTAALIKGVVAIGVGLVSLGMSTFTLCKTLSVMKEAKAAEKATSDAFNKAFEAHTNLSPKDAVGKLSTEAISDASKKAQDVAKLAVEKSAEEIYKTLDVVKQVEAGVNATGQIVNQFGNLFGAKYEQYAAQKDVAVKRSEAREQEFQAFADNLRQLMDSNKELIDSANRTMQTLSDSRVQTMQKILG